jgi:hypothetical protein
MHEPPGIADPRIDVVPPIGVRLVKSEEENSAGKLIGGFPEKLNGASAGVSTRRFRAGFESEDGSFGQRYRRTKNALAASGRHIGRRGLGILGCSERGDPRIDFQGVGKEIKRKDELKAVLAVRRPRQAG